MTLTPMEAGAYRKLDSATVAKAIDLARTGAMNDDIAAVIGVSRSGFYNWTSAGRAESERRFLGHDPDPALDLVVDLVDGIREAQGGIVATLSGVWLTAAANGDWRAAEALLKTRFLHWRPSGIDGAAEGAGTIDQAADLAEAQLSESQARALAGVMRRFGEAMIEKARADGVDAAEREMGALARAALIDGR